MYIHQDHHGSQQGCSYYISTVTNQTYSINYVCVIVDIVIHTLINFYFYSFFALFVLISGDINNIIIPSLILILHAEYGIHYVNAGLTVMAIIVGPVPKMYRSHRYV